MPEVCLHLHDLHVVQEHLASWMLASLKSTHKCTETVYNFGCTANICGNMLMASISSYANNQHVAFTINKAPQFLITMGKICARAESINT